MILILSDEEEGTTDLVIEWLIRMNKPFIRLSCNTPIIILKIYINDNNEIEAVFSVSKNGNSIVVNTADITSYWYRRSYLRMRVYPVESTNKRVRKLLNDYMDIEYKAVINILYEILNKKKKLNILSESMEVNKIWNLNKAKDCHLNIPDFLICCSKTELEPFVRKHPQGIITKPIGDPTIFYDLGINSYTSVVDIDSIPQIFALSLFQEKLEKKFEIRSFYFNERIWSSAIFSQSSKQTEIDFKDYNDDYPNRVVPFKLPDKIEKRVVAFMKNINMNSGSIDIVYTKNDEYVFLEVNPVGQFEQVSVPCNYEIMKIIARSL